MDVEPRIRSALPKELLGTVRRWKDERTERILEAVGPKAIDEIDGGTAIGWTDFATHMHLSDSIRAVVGPEGNVRTWMESFEHVSHRPLLGSFFAAVFRLGGAPGTVFKVTPRVYDLCTRNIGVVRYSHSRAEAVADLQGFPAAEFSIDCYAEGLLGSLRAIMNQADPNGHVEVSRIDPPQGHIAYLFTW